VVCEVDVAPVITHASSAPAGLRLRWRAVEWVGAATALFLQTGAIFPLLLSAPDGTLDGSARTALRLLTLPVTAISAALLARHPGQLGVALRRNLPLALLVGLAFASVLWSVGPSVTLRRAIGLAISLALSFVVAIRFSPRQIMLLIAMALGPSMALSVALAGAAPGLAFSHPDGDLRGVFLNKNVLGWASAVSSLAAAALVADGPGPLRRPAILLLVASLGCLALSQSMTSMVATMAAPGLVAFYLAMARRRGVSRVAFILAALLTGTVGLGLVAEFLVPVLEALGRDATLTGRVPLWRLVDAHIDRRIVLGHGYQAFWSEGHGSAWAIWAQIGWQAPHAHNGYRETLLGLGAVGFIGLFAMIARGMAQGAALSCRDPDGGWLWLNVLAGMVLVMNLSESIFLTQNDFLSTIFLSAIIAFALRARRASDRPRGRR
jgi:exopolysaccharide production protein ExoQ